MKWVYLETWSLARPQLPLMSYINNGYLQRPAVLIHSLLMNLSSSLSRLFDRSAHQILLEPSGDHTAPVNQGVSARILYPISCADLHKIQERHENHWHSYSPEESGNVRSLDHANLQTGQWVLTNQSGL